MAESDLDIRILQPGEKIVGIAYLTADGEIVFSRHPDMIEVVLVEAQPGSTGPWAVRRRAASSVVTPALRHPVS